MEKVTEKVRKAPEPKIKPVTDSSKFYELGYLLLPTLSAEQAVKEMDALGALFTSRGGQFISGEMPIMIDLAYPMLKVIHANRQKCDEGYFGWMKYEIETEKIAEIKKALDESENILRYLLITTVRENTLISGKMNLIDEEKTKKSLPEDSEDSLEAPAALDEVALDKSIDDLVIA